MYCILCWLMTVIGIKNSKYFFLIAPGRLLFLVKILWSEEIHHIARPLWCMKNWYIEYIFEVATTSRHWFFGNIYHDTNSFIRRNFFFQITFNFECNGNYFERQIQQEPDTINVITVAYSNTMYLTCPQHVWASKHFVKKMRLFGTFLVTFFRLYVTTSFFLVSQEFQQWPTNFRQ